MFANIIYYDKDKIDNYKTEIKGEKNVEIEEYQVSNDKGFELSMSIAKGDAKATKSYKAKFQESLLYECMEFEKMLKGRDDYLDFTVSNDYDLNTSCRGQIVKFEGSVCIPEEFDLTQIIHKFKPMFIETIVDEDMDESERAVLEAFLKTSNAKIPAIIKYDGHLMASKLISENMKVEYEDMEEYEDSEVTIIARITSNSVKSKLKPFYDPLKDFMTLNRAMRKSLQERTDGLYELYAEEDYRNIEILIIYQ